MKIKRYTAASMRAALAQVRAEQGPDAVILSSRRSDDGIEVIAAVDYDEALFVEANRQRAPAPTIAVQPAAVITAPASVPASAPAPMPARIAAVTRPDLGFGAMQRELQELRQMLESGLAGMTWNDKRLREPLKARVLEELSAMDIAPDVAMALAAHTPRRTTLKNPSHIPLALLVKHLPVVDDLAGVSGGVMAVVGPTGAGKTTTIAKLAARWCMRHGSEDLALVSTDGYRIGARDQLMTYARILGAPMHAANSGRDLSRVLDRLRSKKLVLIDTAGMGPRDVRLAEQLAALQLGAARARVLLALPAQGEVHALDEIVRAFAPVTPVACILTKVDEAASLGAVISATLRHRLKIAYLCNGQRVPEDLHAAHHRRVWLVRTALALQKGRPALRDEAYYVRNFGRAHAHA
ncbi:MAG: flagellar biosynthesis protein FlhF [Gammaproteobacteria bacterium]